MSINPKMLQKSGKFRLTNHAKERIRQRVGIESVEEAAAWANVAIAKADESKVRDKFVHFYADEYEFICDGLAVVTVTPYKKAADYVEKLGGVLEKEVTKLLKKYTRELRKLEISVAQFNLNFLKAKNPKIKAGIKEKLDAVTDEKVRIEDEIKNLTTAAKRFGVEV